MSCLSIPSACAELAGRQACSRCITADRRCLPLCKLGNRLLGSSCGWWSPTQMLQLDQAAPSKTCTAPPGIKQAALTGYPSAMASEMAVCTLAKMPLLQAASRPASTDCGTAPATSRMVWGCTSRPCTQEDGCIQHSLPDCFTYWPSWCS